MTGVPPIEQTTIRRGAAQTALRYLLAAFLLVAPFPSSAGLRATLLIVAGVVVAFEALRSRASPWPLVPQPLVVAGLAWIVLCTASVAWSDNPRYSWEELQREVVYGALAFAVALATAREPADLRAATWASLGGTVLLGAGAWLARAFPAAPLAERYVAIEGSFSTQIVLVAPLLLIVAARPPAGLAASGRTVAVVALLLAASGFATENRMMWIALMAAVATTALAWRRGGADHMAPGSRKALAVALAVMAAAFAASSAYKASLYYPNGSTAESLSFDERPLVWDSAGDQFDQRPWLGHGFGREIVGDGIADGLARRGSGHWWLRHGHDVFVDTALQMGVAGLIAFTALVASLLAAFGTATRHREQWPLGAAGLAMTVAMLVKNLTDDFYYRPSSLVFWALAGMLLGLAARWRRSA